MLFINYIRSVLWFIMSLFEFDYANLSNIEYIEHIYKQYLENPKSVDPSFRRFFEGMQFSESLNKILPGVSDKMPCDQQKKIDFKDLRSLRLIEAYRRFGHLQARCNPVDEEQAPYIKELDIETYGFSSGDMDKEVNTFGFFPQEKVVLKELIDALKKTYSHALGVEAFHVKHDVQDYIYSRIEPFLEAPLKSDQKLAVLNLLNKSELFESFLHMRYPGQKRFSLEGGESLIPMLMELYQTLASLGAEESILGMAHRGRLNVLANVLNKSYKDIFCEFEPAYIPNSIEGSGDVKYHKGASSVISLEGVENFKIFLADNPSHLESVNTVVMGMTKARQISKKHGENLTHIVPVLIHGDASVAGQGVVYEGLQMMNLNGYSVGGSIHIVINNQVGFTATANESRSTKYPTDIAKAFGCPVFHVNGDDPETCCFAARIAAEIRQKFGLDVFIELVCYRKYGHNEGDEPAFTQPQLYERIKKKKNVRNIYKDKLLEDKIITQETADSLEEKFKQLLEEAIKETQGLVSEKKRIDFSQVIHPQIDLKDVFLEVNTKVDGRTLKNLAEKFCYIPEEFNVHAKIQRLFNSRLESVLDEKQIDWGLAEYLAYASLLIEGCPIRISGQDSQRGTFSHRHAAIVDQVSEKKYFPLQHLSENQAPFSIYNSCLSEYGVLGFEFGYSSFLKEGLTIWEAQFGDFANGAQVLIDQYIVASEQKWGLKSPLVLFLPHGYEGMGPEHSSARIERFLQLSSSYNLEVVVPTTPSQVFHLLRKHVLTKVMKPLIIFTPKELLRYPPSLSSFNSLTEGSFEEIIDDPSIPESATRILLCSGKIYYDLIEEREKKKANHIAIIRIEKLYPFHKDKFKKILSSYSHAKECFFVQEEHSNMGAYSYLNPHIREMLPDNLKLCYVGRARSASTAAGSYALHNYEKTLILDQAFGKLKSS